MRQAYLITILFILQTSVAFTEQPSKIDSLESVLEKIQADTSKIKAHIKLFLAYEFTDTSIAKSHLGSVRVLALKQQHKKWIATYYYYMGWFYDDMGKYPLALRYNQLALLIRESLNDKVGLTKTYSNIGLVYRKQGNYPMALKYQLMGLKIEEELGNKRGIAHSLNSIGLVYWNLENYSHALEYYKKSLKIAVELGVKESVAYALNNIGLINEHQNNYEEAMKNYLLSAEICEKIGKNRLLAIALNNIGNIHHKERKYKLALQYYKSSLSIHKKVGNKIGVAGSLINIGNALLDIGESSAEEILSISEESYTMSKELGTWSYINESAQLLSKVYGLQRDFNLSVKYFAEALSAKDSLFNEGKNREIGRLEANYEFEKAEVERNKLEEEHRVALVKVQQRRDNLQYSAILIIIIILFTGMFLIARLNIPIKLAEGIVFFSFLLFFEFTLVLLDPYIEVYSSGAPAIKLAFNAVLAALIFPMHSFFEKKLKHQITN